jgi:hypothetical protein
MTVYRGGVCGLPEIDLVRRVTALCKQSRQQVRGAHDAPDRWTETAKSAAVVWHSPVFATSLESRMAPCSTTTTWDRDR